MIFQLIDAVYCKTFLQYRAADAVVNNVFQCPVLCIFLFVILLKLASVIFVLFTSNMPILLEFTE